MSSIFVHSVFFILLTNSLLVSCKSYAQKRSAIRSDGDIAGKEILLVTEKIAKQIRVFLGENNLQPILAIVPIKNDTTDEIPVDVVKGYMLKALNDNGIEVTEIENRQEALKEIAFSQSGVGNKELDVSKIAIASHFIRIKLSEQMTSKNGVRTLKRFVQTDLSEVEGGLVLWTMNQEIVFKRKKPGGIGW